MSKIGAIFLGFTWLLAGCTGLGLREADTPAIKTGPSMVEVFYATGRKASSENGVYFGAERAELSYGVFEVGIPPRHLVGRMERPSLMKFEYDSDETKHVTLQWQNNYSSKSFYHFLNKAIERTDSRKLLIFTHGYNMGFAKAVRSLGQFSADLKFSPALLFSWPSQDSLVAYAQDGNQVEWAQAQFLEMLKGILDNTSVREIQLVGHSMGTRLAVNGLLTLAANRPERDLERIKNLVLIAPDIDADLFRRDLAPRLEGTHVPVTLYASSADSALMASKTFFGYPRAGDSGAGLVVVNGVETIDASVASGGVLGHAYFAEDPRIIGDFFSLLQSGQKADQRFALQPVDGKGGRYWVFRK